MLWFSIFCIKMPTLTQIAAIFAVKNNRDIGFQIIAIYNKKIASDIFINIDPRSLRCLRSRWKSATTPPRPSATSGCKRCARQCRRRSASPCGNPTTSWSLSFTAGRLFRDALLSAEGPTVTERAQESILWISIFGWNLFWTNFHPQNWTNFHPKISYIHLSRILKVINTNLNLA
jgi:hypothetical protein